MSQPNEEGRQPLSPQIRKILQQWFETGSRAAAKGDFDYAESMFAQCLSKDPGNLIYVNSYLGNLQKKYNNNKKGSKLGGFKTAGSKANIKKLALQKDWEGVLRVGLEILHENPWDPTGLSTMAHACEEQGYDECQLAYLRAMLDVDIKNADYNRQMGRALERQGQFDGAINCWKRVLAAKPSDEEAAKKVHNLTVKKTIKDGKYDGAETTKDVRVNQSEEDVVGPVRTPEEKLERLIKKNPADLQNYYDLVDLHLKAEQFDSAEKVLERALSASGGDIHVRERLEDVQLRSGREHVSIAERKHQNENTEDSKQLLHAMKAELLKREVEVFRARVDRHPSNLAYKFELAERLKKTGQYKEAIVNYQKALLDPRRKGVVLLALGDCFHNIHQHKLAISNYEQAAEDLADKEPDIFKKALYRCGCMWFALKDLDRAEKYLTQLAGMDFSYRDVADQLDKVREMRQNQ